MALAGAIVNTAIKHADDRRVRLITLRVGGMRQVVLDSLEFYFDFAARDTCCEGAGLELISVATRLRCRSCGEEWEPEIPAFRCPKCASADVEIIAGEEFEVDSIEVDSVEVDDDKEASCTAPK
jgi:hydrogenase nickel incorporation protein HypA/HybF